MANMSVVITWTPWDTKNCESLGEYEVGTYPVPAYGGAGKMVARIVHDLMLADGEGNAVYKAYFLDEYPEAGGASYSFSRLNQLRRLLNS